ncbi:hypothetical protein [Deinococcus radiophilus]|uniref:Uncharacterized protein n=1 Tax=Deinococcus radiophilus TaxID=32062 RepID=A0A3S0KI27_9DEIO|nr:hypothetical protein [Deinococcus radiophilus]RTR27284.1 hypothetical protein EJ104_06940 [Deinococcus radiophilus]UFA50632.1 hypothetical protein LMT64_01590 [Deinococcus radiophilus]
MKRRGRRSPTDRTPLRATAMWRVDQVFLARKGQRLEVTCSLVNDQGDLRNLSVVAPTSDPVAAVRHAAAFVAARGNVYSAEQARLRWTHAQMHTEQDALERDYALEDEFFDAFEEVRLEVLDRLS